MSIVLLHGLGRRAFSMLPLERAARKRGHVVLRLNYPSLRKSPQELLEGWIQPALELARREDPQNPVNIITHSLGGILVRMALAGECPSWLGRVVMICPPNAGSEIIDFLRAHRMDFFVGPTGKTLGTNAESLPQTLPAISFPCGVIGADRGMNPIADAILPAPHDGKVSVASMQAAGVRDFALVHTSHTFSMMHGQVKALALRYVETGFFEGSANPKSKDGKEPAAPASKS